MKIIVVSYGDDSHKNHFLKIAHKAGVETLLFDAGGYPSQTQNDQISIEYKDADPQLTLTISGQLLNPNEIGGVWWRRPRGAKIKNCTAMEQYIRLEGEVVIRSLKDFLPNVNWVSDPEATRMAGRKPVQLMVAKRTGLKIPETCISNSPDVVKSFIKHLQGRKMIMKPVGTSFIELAKDDPSGRSCNKVIFTQIVDYRVVLDNIAMVKNCPVIFQEAIEKESDVRVTVVDDKVFCAEIILEGCSNPNNVDWRNHDGIRVYRRHELPDEIKRKCTQFTKAMGLRFGCIDMAYSRKGGYTFFEINPQGQWLPSEEDVGHPISAALLEALTRARRQ